MPYFAEPLPSTLSMTTAEEPAVEAMVVQRRILLSFGAIVLMSVVLCGTYIAQKTGAPVTTGAPKIMAAANPPAPLPDSASPYQARKTEAHRVSPPSPLKLDMLATQDAWVEVATDGQAIYAKLVRANQTLSFVASERIRFMTGNAKGLELQFNGKLVDAVASKGSVRTFEFTAAGSRDLNSVQPVRKL
jgi:hypothetical protein